MTKVKTATTAAHSGHLQPEDESQNSNNRLTFRRPTTRGQKSKQRQPPHIQATYNQRTKVKTATTASHSGHLQPEDESQNSENRSHSAHLQPEDESQNSDNRLRFRITTTRGRKSKQRQPPHIQATYNQRTKVKTATTASHSGHLQPEDESQNNKNRLTFRLPTTRGRKSKQRQPPHIQATYNQRTKVKTATTASHSGDLQPEDESQNSDNRSHSGQLQPEDESQNSDNRLTFRLPTTRGRKSKQRQPPHIQATYNQRTKVKTATIASHSGQLQPEDESQNSDNRLTFRPPTTRGRKSKQQKPPHIQATYNQRTKVKTATTASHSGHLQPEDESQNSDNRLTFRPPTTRGRKSKQQKPPHIQATYNQRTKVKTATSA